MNLKFLISSISIALALTACSDSATKPDGGDEASVSSSDELSVSSCQKVVQSSSSNGISSPSSSLAASSSEAILSCSSVKKSSSSIATLSSSSTVIISSSMPSSSSEIVSSSSAYWNQAISYGTLTDSRDGHSYRTVVIGTQTWMAENLAYLPSVNNDEYYASTGMLYYVYGYHGTSVVEAKANTVNDTNYYSLYGVIYSELAAIPGGDTSSLNPSGVKGVCPTDWHLPSMAEWDVLEAYAGGYPTAGITLRSANIWDNTDYQGTDVFGFSLLPGGGVDSDGSVGSTKFARWWTTTTYDDDREIVKVYSNSNSLGMDYFGSLDYVRCIKD